MTDQAKQLARKLCATEEAFDDTDEERMISGWWIAPAFFMGLLAVAAIAWWAV